MYIPVTSPSLSPHGSLLPSGLDDDPKEGKKEGSIDTRDFSAGCPVRYLKWHHNG